ncbi:MAG: anaerobic ribonucleoside-triphosphate reductase activating protein [Clostridia bacterium]|nr:anaerobic ribonucleoside-triphosphate reductase activating protein [Clostridia bacterium]MBQ9735369.1 anaerobic ribonucleoside-triphosphate reductase activating protein [Clostridia bacterium]
MLLRGLQKTTLLDFPGKVASTVFTGGCNFRCPFCHNASLIRADGGEDRLSEENFFAFLKKRRGLNDGVCITGGEPLLQKDIVPFIKRIRDEGFFVKLDTNGSYPEVLGTLCDEGLLDYVAMDVKNAPAAYAKTAGVSEDILPKIEQSIAILKRGTVPYEFRTTVVKGLHTEQTMRAIGEWLGDVPAYFIQNFTDSGDVLVGGLSGFTPSELTALLDAVKPYIPSARVRGM